MRSSTTWFTSKNGKLSQPPVGSGRATGHVCLWSFVTISQKSNISRAIFGVNGKSNGNSTYCRQGMNHLILPTTEPLLRSHTLNLRVALPRDTGPSSLNLCQSPCIHCSSRTVNLFSCSVLKCLKYAISPDLFQDNYFAAAFFLRLGFVSINVLTSDIRNISVYAMTSSSICAPIECMMCHTQWKHS